MSHTDENKIAKEAFVILYKALPEGQFILKSNYKDPCKIAISLMNNRIRVVLVWRSRKNRELTTRKEYSKSLNKWFPGFQLETNKGIYCSQILDTVKIADLFSIVKNEKTNIANEIIKIAATLG